MTHDPDDLADDVELGRFRLLLDYHRLPCRAEESAVADGPSTVRQALDVAEHYLGAQQVGAIPRHREAFAVLLLNARHRPIALHVVSVGTLNSTCVHPREVFRPAIAAGAASLILAHHHPSGDASPSPEDKRVTERMREVGELLGIQVLDHVVIGGGRLFSFADERYAPLPAIQRRLPADGPHQVLPGGEQ